MRFGGVIMAVQGGNNYQGLSEMLIERMTDIRDTYQEAKKNRLKQERKTNPSAMPSSAYKFSFRSGQKSYKKNHK